MWFQYVLLAPTFPKPPWHLLFINLAFLWASLVNVGDGACIPQCHPGSTSPAHAHTQSFSCMGLRTSGGWALEPGLSKCIMSNNI